jgi:hypothetical protein
LCGAIQQTYFKDAPVVKSALGSAALLKRGSTGRSKEYGWLQTAPHLALRDFDKVASFIDW